MTTTTYYGEVASNVGWDDKSVAYQITNRLGRVFDSIAALRAVDITKYTRFFLTGYYNPGDGGGGDYYYNPNDTTSADNGGSIIIASAGPQPTARIYLAVTGAGVISCKQFGAVGNNIADDTVALNNWLALGGNLYLAPGTYKTTGVLKLWPNTDVKGAGRGQSIISCTGGNYGLQSATVGVTQLLYSRISDVQFVDNSAAGLAYIIDMRDMMFCKFERCFTYGAGKAGSIGIYMASSNTNLQCTYNEINNHYWGNTQYGGYLTDGANANTFLAGRAQLGLANAIGIILAPTTLNGVNGNTFIQVGFESPGNTMVGIQLNGNTEGTVILSPRCESLLKGIVISATDQDVSIINPYFSGCTTNIVDTSGVALVLYQGAITANINPIAAVSYVGGSSTTLNSVNCSVSKSGTGAYVVTLSPAAANTSYKPICSAGIFQCAVTVVDASTFHVNTYDAVGTATDAAFTGVVFK